VSNDNDTNSTTPGAQPVPYTPTPWREMDGYHNLMGSNGELVASFFSTGDERRANMDLARLAVNSYAAAFGAGAVAAAEADALGEAIRQRDEWKRKAYEARAQIREGLPPAISLTEFQLSALWELRELDGVTMRRDPLAEGENQDEWRNLEERQLIVVNQWDGKGLWSVAATERGESLAITLSLALGERVTSNDARTQPHGGPDAD
jgi:hypothetical protein